MTNIRFGHSPDPDDAFMFYAIAKNKIDTKEFKIVHVVEDIESLNQRALKAEIEVTAVSVHAYAHIHNQYAIMRSGASMGDQYGPILVARQELRAPVPGTVKSWLRGKKIAIPGTLTTAYLALKLFEPDIQCVTIPFDQILNCVRNSPHLSAKQRSGSAEYSGGNPPPQGGRKFRGDHHPQDGRKVLDDSVSPSPHVEKGKGEVADNISPSPLAGEGWGEGVDCGLVIHEGQLTYQEYGLYKILDLGEWWWRETGLPLPLGVDVIRKNLGAEKMKSFSQVFKESILYSLKSRKEALQYALPYGRGISEETGDQFVGMYVNDYTVDLGPNGEKSIRELLKRGYEQKILSKLVVPEFV